MENGEAFSTRHFQATSLTVQLVSSNSTCGTDQKAQRHASRTEVGWKTAEPFPRVTSRLLAASLFFAQRRDFIPKFISRKSQLILYIIHPSSVSPDGLVNRAVIPVKFLNYFLSQKYVDDFS